MTQAFCVRLACDCGKGMIWAADVQWLAKEGVDVTGSTSFLLPSQRLPLPDDARNVTGTYNVRCPSCCHLLPVLPIIRARVLAGTGILLNLPSPSGRMEPAPQEGSFKQVDRAARLLNREGRRAPRVAAESGMTCQAFTTFDTTIVDLSTLGIQVQHTHQVQVGNLYTLRFSLPPDPQVLKIHARVVWTAPFRIEQIRGERRTIYRSGFEFTDVPLAAEAAIEAYVIARLTLPEGAARQAREILARAPGKQGMRPV